MARRIGAYAVLIAGGLLMMIPFFWMLLTSLKTRAEVFGAPPLSLPTRPPLGELRADVERVRGRDVRHVLPELAQDRDPEHDRRGVRVLAGGVRVRA